jgi:hypothetical protein
VSRSGVGWGGGGKSGAGKGADRDFQRSGQKGKQGGGSEMSFIESLNSY